MNDLDEAILLEILIRLPAKVANRFKCVSKRWRILISQPYFVRHFIYQNSCASSTLPFTLMFHHYNKEGRKQLYPNSDSQVFKSGGFSLSFLPCYQAQDKVPICVLGSYNDLLLCCSNSTCENIVYYICNPTTVQFVELPPAPQSDKKEFHVKFVCDPISEQFGKQSCTAIINTTKYAYTIVRIPEFTWSATRFKIEKFSSDTNQWSELHVTLPQSFKFSPTASDSVFCNQILYWICQSDGILAIDILRNYDDDRCRFIDLPSDFEKNVYSSCIGVSQGRLHLSQLHVYRPDLSHLSNLHVWELEDNSAGKWCLEHKVLIDEMAAETSELKEACRISAFNLALYPDNADIIYFSIPFRVVSYNMRCRTLKLASSIIHNKKYFFNDDVILPFKLPCWPTPVPILP